jgi:hypothetical protein
MRLIWGLVKRFVTEGIIKPAMEDKKKESIGKYLLFSGLGCAVLLAVSATVFLSVDHIVRTAPPAPAPSPVRNVSSAPLAKAPPVEPLKISDLQIEKHPAANSTTVIVKFKVWNFASDNDGPKPHIHLIQDLKTYDPKGTLVQDLSREGIMEKQDIGDFEHADISNTLNIPISDPTGKYKVKLTVHDQIANIDAEATTEFELP